CLMGNHVHLLLKVGKEDLPIIFRRIGGSFVYWYNWKYQRSGHLFQDRYKSEPVEDDAYLLTVARYIHQNPVKAGLCKNPGGYAYSSYNEYIDIKKTNLADPEFLLEIIGKDEFIKYHQTENRDACLETGGTMRPPDKEAQKIIKKITGCGNQSEFQKLDPKNIDLYIKKLREKGLSIRQINRLTGVSYAVARKN
ncbi:MAG: transposase, partial [Oscillospiraceae bacterium]|nr:transposase [Oscillospiraceae bacterium]